MAAFLARHPEFALADVFGNVDYTFGSAGEANRTGGLPLDVSKVRRIWPCQGGEGHFIARLVKAGTPRALSAPGCYPPKSSSGWRLPLSRTGSRSPVRASLPARSAAMPVHPAGRTPAPSGMRCRAAAAAKAPRQGRA